MDIELDARFEPSKIRLKQASLTACASCTTTTTTPGASSSLNSGTSQRQHRKTLRARSFFPKRFQNPDSGWVPLVLDANLATKPPLHLPRPSTAIVDEVQQRYGLSDSRLVVVAPRKAPQHRPKTRRGANLQSPVPQQTAATLSPAGTFHPLKLIHVGLAGFHSEEEDLALPPRVRPGAP